MAGWADLIPRFENWPHPRGVVRSHDTLATLLYYAASVQEQKKQLPESAPGLLLVEDLRVPGNPLSYTLEEPIASIYLACSDKPRTASAAREIAQRNLRALGKPLEVTRDGHQARDLN